ncbi:MAG: hypothetical protein R3F59_26040 [Myxococcota bacterium]
MLTLLFALFAPAASAGTLPGVNVPFDADAEGRWVLSDPLPDGLAKAGAQPGWVLVAVDDVPFTTGLDAQKQIADGGARNVRLRFRDEAAPPPKKGKAPPPPPETVLVVKRAPLVQVEPVATLTLPVGLVPPPGGWERDWRGAPTLPDAEGHRWVLDPGTEEAQASWHPAPQADDHVVYTPAKLPEVFWSLSDAAWVVQRADAVQVGGTAWAREQFGGAVRLRSFQAATGDHLLVAGPSGVEVYAVTWPVGVPNLPTCNPSVPETCLASGRQILAELGNRAGAREEALDHLRTACEQGVYRGCYEAVALEEPDTTERVDQCLDEADVATCNGIARDRYEIDPEQPDPVVIGLLEYACTLEGSGTLGERLRRLEDVGEGCMMLSAAYDANKMPDLALLILDQACVLGRAEACEQAADRRHQAFAARTVRECEDPEVPVAASCVELGKLLQDEERPIESTSLDEFGAFLRGCQLGAANGCLALGDYVDRWGIENPRVMQAEQDLQAACSQGEQRACLGAAHLLVRHEPRTDAYAQALVLFNGACQAGLGAACVGGAEQRRIGQAKKVDAPTQEEMWTAACDRQDPEGCAGLGQRLARQKAGWTDAYAAWTRACDLGDAHACSELGRLVAREHDTAWEGEQPPDSYLERGCDNGDPEGCFWLAEESLPRKGEPPEPTYLLLERSCDGEYGAGCAELASVHIERRTSFDDEIAARHFDTACNNGEYESCKSLGLMYLRGKGVDRDRQRANELLDRFRLNQQRKYVRVGASIGIAQGAGGELELLVPIPVGPAISVSGNASYLPGLGTFMVLLEGEDKPKTAPDLQYLGASARLYPNHQGRGMFAAVGVHQLVATGGSIGADRTRIGWNARLGMRNDAKLLYSGIEIGFGQYGEVDIHDFDEDSDGKFPLILPSFALTFGLAPI